MAGSFVTVGSGDHHVIALHGWFGSALGWGHLADYLNTEQFSYVFPDLRGYGSRRDEAGEYTRAEAAADAIALADDLGWDRFSLICNSMSGVAIQHMLLQAPHRIRRLIGVAPVPASGLPLGEHEWALFTGAAASRENREGIVNFATGSRLPRPSSTSSCGTRWTIPMPRPSPATCRPGRAPTSSPRSRAPSCRSRSSPASTTRPSPPSSWSRPGCRCTRTPSSRSYAAPATTRCSRPRSPSPSLSKSSLPADKKEEIYPERARGDSRREP